MSRARFAVIVPCCNEELTVRKVVTDFRAVLPGALVYVIDNKQFPLESGKQTYSMGPGGDWDTERPVKIQRAGVVYYKTDENDLLEGLRKPLEMIDSVRWAEIREKPMTAFEPLEVYNDNEYPLTYLSLWPIPICP